LDRIGIYHGGSIFTSERTDHDRTYFFFTTFTTRLFDSAVVRDCQTIKSARVEASLFFRPNVDRLRLFVRHPFSILINNESYSTMLIKGEKYACEACVRGHRVSNCQHSDRPLQHINKKGRPVSQCTHCRTLRKSRSAHVRCECGEKAHTKGGCSHDTDAQGKHSIAYLRHIGSSF